MNPEKTRHTLITNIHFAQRASFRFYCSALLISEDPGKPGEEESPFHGPRYELRGFGASGDQPVFSTQLNKTLHLPFKLEPVSSAGSAEVLGNDGVATPLFGGAMLLLKNGDCYFLQVSDERKPLDVHAQTGDITRIWALLSKKVVEYWSRPNMGWLTWGPPAQRRVMVDAAIERGQFV